MPRIIDAAKRDRNAISIYGCPEVDALALNEGRPLREPGGLALAYTTQRLAARRRGIGWELTFEQWLRLWRASGRLADRGSVPAAIAWRVTAIGGPTACRTCRFSCPRSIRGTDLGSAHSCPMSWLSCARVLGADGRFGVALIRLWWLIGMSGLLRHVKRLRQRIGLPLPV